MQKYWGPESLWPHWLQLEMYTCLSCISVAVSEGLIWPAKSLLPIAIPEKELLQPDCWAGSQQPQLGKNIPLPVKGVNQIWNQDDTINLDSQSTFYSAGTLRTSRAKSKYLTWQKGCTGQELPFLLYWQITGVQALKLKNLVVWTHEFKVVGPWELCGSLHASGLRMLSQRSLGYLLWKYTKPKIPHMAKVCQATEDLVWPAEQGGKPADFQQWSQFVG